MPSLFQAWHLLALALPVFTSPVDDGSASSLFERGVCNRDNLLRCFDPTAAAAASTRAVATEFCSSFLSIPVVTSVISTETSTRTTATVTDISTVTLPPVVRRAIIRRGATANPIACTSRYSPAQLSSACSCLSIVPSTTQTTVTSTSTIVEIATNTVVATETPAARCIRNVNLVSNPSFESGSSSWSLVTYGANKPAISFGVVGGGANSNNAYGIQSGNEGTGVILSQQINGLVIGAQYTFSYEYMFKTNNIASSINCGVYAAGLSSQSITNGNGENTWLRGPSNYGMAPFTAKTTSGSLECTFISRGAMSWKVDNFYLGC